MRSRLRMEEEELERYVCKRESVLREEVCLVVRDYVG